MLLKNTLKKWHARSGAERQLFVEAGFWLWWAWVAVKIMPFKQLVTRLGCKAFTPTVESTVISSEDTIQIGWAVRAAARRMAGANSCLLQAIAAQKMLSRRGLPGEIVFGVLADETDTRRLKAHAWVRAGDTILTGAAGHRQFTPVSMFLWD